MKIAIPVNNNKEVANHFGRCEKYICFDEQGARLKDIPNTSEHMGGQGLPPELLEKYDVDILLCKDLGPNAITLCNEKNITVYKDLNTNLVTDLFNSWKSGKLTEVTSNGGCSSHSEG